MEIHEEMFKLELIMFSILLIVTNWFGIRKQIHAG